VTTKQFLLQLLYIGLFILGVLGLVILWLRFYTNHGQQLELPSYENSYLSEAQRDASDRSFNIIVNDSIHIVGKDGGIITTQNPKPGSKVKENRKIYVTITKFQPDTWQFDDLPALYGNDFEQKRRELSYMEINSNIKGYEYDPGEPNHILEVWYKGEIISSKNIERKDVDIEKGGTLEFVLSEQSGGLTAIPDLRCRQLSELTFYLPSAKLALGEVSGGSNGDFYVVSQDPAYTPSGLIERGSKINVVVQEQKPENCN
jgi:beta-lactam-binding protein with PASTA domain